MSWRSHDRPRAQAIALAYYRAGGILPYVLDQLAKGQASSDADRIEEC